MNVGYGTVIVIAFVEFRQLFVLERRLSGARFARLIVAAKGSSQRGLSALFDLLLMHVVCRLVYVRRSD